jgi:hypothetical protein
MTWVVNNGLTVMVCISLTLGIPKAYGQATFMWDNDEAPVLATGYYFVMDDPRCKITWNDNRTIDYQDCAVWSFVASEKLGPGEWKLFTKGGETCYYRLTSIGNRLAVKNSISLPSRPCYDFMLQRR